MAYYNPFIRHEAHTRRVLNTHRVLAVLSWLLVVVVGLNYSVNKPWDVPHGHTIWEQAELHPTAFSQNVVVTAVFWILLLLFQVSYLWHIFSQDPLRITAAANVASHFTLNNLFIFAFIMLWVRNHFWPAEVILAVHQISQTTAYWIHLRSPPLVKLSAISGPYAWTLTALFWNGAVAVGSNGVAARLAANVFIWVIFVIGLGHIILVKDYLGGYALSLLLLSLAVEQFELKIISLQWIFAFVIFAIFLFESLYVSSVVYWERDIFWRIISHDSSDREREPLLTGQESG